MQTFIKADVLALSQRWLFRWRWWHYVVCNKVQQQPTTMSRKKCMHTQWTWRGVNSRQPWNFNPPGMTKMLFSKWHIAVKYRSYLTVLVLFCYLKKKMFSKCWVWYFLKSLKAVIFSESLIKYFLVKCTVHQGFLSDFQLGATVITYLDVILNFSGAYFVLQLCI